MEDLIDAPPVTDPSEGDYFANMVKEVQSAIENPAAEPPAPAAKAPETPKPEAEKPAEKPAAEKPEGDKPAAEADDIDKIKKPEAMSPKSSEMWDELKSTSRNYKAKAEAAETAIEGLRTELAVLKETAGKPTPEIETQLAELAELRAQREAYEAAQKELSIARVEGTDDYKKTITKPLNVIAERAKEIAKANELSADQILDAIAERDPVKQRAALNEMLPGLPPVDQLTLVRMAEDARGIFDRKDQIEENVVEAAKELAERQEKESATAKANFGKEFAAGAENAAAEIKKRFPFIELAEGETSDGVFGNLLQKAKETDFEAASPATKATAALSVLALERAMLQLQKVTEENKTLKARVAEQRQAEPGNGGDPQPTVLTNNGGGLLNEVFAALGQGPPRSAAEMLISGGK